MIARVTGELGVGWTERDITTSHEDLDRYAEMIPVTLIDGVQHDFWRVSEDRLRAALLALTGGSYGFIRIAGSKIFGWHRVIVVANEQVLGRSAPAEATTRPTLCKRSQGRTVVMKSHAGSPARACSLPSPPGVPAHVPPFLRRPVAPRHPTAARDG